MGAATQPKCIEIRHFKKKHAMTKYFMALILGLLTMPMLHAQLFFDLGGGVSFTGSNLNETVKTDQLSVKSEGMTHYVAALRTGVPLRNRMELRTELQYAVRGSAKLYSPGIGQRVYERYHYIALQPEVAYKLLQNRLVLRGGANIGYMSAAWSKSEFFEWQKYDKDYRETLFNVFEAGAVFGLEWWINKRIFVRTDFYHAISPVSEIQYTNLNGEPLGAHQTRNRSISLGLGYRLLR